MWAVPLDNGLKKYGHKRDGKIIEKVRENQSI